MECGVIYVATGDGFRALAEASARSLRAVEPGLAVDVFTDDPDAVSDGVFDRVHPIYAPHARSKLECMGRTRFDRTLYLDCDTLVLAPLADLFDLLVQFDLALAHDMRRDTETDPGGIGRADPICVSTDEFGRDAVSANRGGSGVSRKVGAAVC